MPINYKRSKYNSNKNNFFNNNSFKQNLLKSSLPPRNGPVLDFSIDNSSVPIVNTLEEVLSTIKKMQKPGKN